MSPYYTRSGDDGKTGMLGEGRLPKYHLRMETLGTLDEATAALGLARSICQARQTSDLIIDIQQDLYLLMAEVAASPHHAARFRKLDPSRLEWLEIQTDSLGESVHPPSGFILPGNSQAGAVLSLARAIVRRAERHLAEMLDKKELENPLLLKYLNRLSSLCFLLELLEDQTADRVTRSAKSKKQP